jgi:photosystem II stability/assembly factor-like uncharacterized protein
MTELLVGSKKGLFVLRGDPGDSFELAHRAFAGDVVEYAIRDPRSGRYFASVTSGFYGPRVFFSDDPAGEWRQATGPAFPADIPDSSVTRVWVVQPAEEPGVLWAGAAPASLWRSEDDGETWTLNRPLWNVPTRPDWQPGAGGLALHSICPWPGEPNRLAVGISAAGVWLTDDRGESWRTGYAGLVPGYLPEDAREGSHALCIHNMRRAPRRPDRLFMQFHGSVYRSDDAGSSWADISSGLPSGFGFPLVVDAADPDCAYVIPLTADVDRVTPDGRMRVYETRDAGASWTARQDGLPAEDAYLTVLRQAFDADPGSPPSLYFGATSGDVFGSADGGQSWFAAASRIAPVNSVRISR